MMNTVFSYFFVVSEVSAWPGTAGGRHASCHPGTCRKLLPSSTQTAFLECPLGQHRERNRSSPSYKPVPGQADDKLAPGFCPGRLMRMFARPPPAMLSWLGFLLAVASACAPKLLGPQAPPPAPATRIEHLVLIVQENHSFDNYFGSWCGGVAPAATPDNPGPSPHMS